MTTGQANRWVVISAVTVGGIYGWSSISGTAKANPAQFMVAWGVVFFVLALVASGAPGLAASLAILILTADFLANMPAIAQLIASGEGRAVGTPAPTPGGALPGVTPAPAGQTATAQVIK